ncbi:beta-lactamase family protein [Xylaria sp. CBS 124048]|nr:beta-lactamase family protein [Xylaria sp. CBS 124048]
MDYLTSPAFSFRVRDLINRHHIPGLSIAILKDEQIFSSGYGQASLDPPKPCTADTLFDIASSSKSLTAASVALLVRDNDKYPEVRYEATMSSLLRDDFVMSGQGYTENVTVEDVLSHRTGLPRHDDSYLGIRASHPDTARSVTRNLRNLAVAAPLRSKYLYTNIMYTVATHLIEQKTGLAFADFLQERFFTPLQMNSTHLQPARAKAAGLGDRLATGYAWDDKQEKYAGFEALDTPEAQGAGSIITSANDYLKWVKALMNREHPVDEEVYRGLIRLRSFSTRDAEDREPMTSPLAYAAGLEVFYYRGYMVVGHDGAVAGFGSRHFFVPEVKLGGVILGNTENAGSVATILSRELIDEALGVPETERPDWEKMITRRDRDEEGRLDEPACALCDTDDELEPQKMPLEAYVGVYWNPGYHGMTVQIKDGGLFIDASDRSMGYTLVFRHVREQTEYVAHLSAFQAGGDEHIAARFVFENDRAVKMGLRLEWEIDEMIWFVR